MDSKETTSHAVADDTAGRFDSDSELEATQDDKKDMERMGKKQQLMRNFQRISAFSFTVILTATWEYLLM
jgi:hypothetical protein